MTVDVEEWYQGEFTRKGIGNKPRTRVINSLAKIIELFDTYNTKATFFIVGETLSRYPKSGEMILEANHELGYHGWDHKPLWDLNKQEFNLGLRKFQDLLDEWNYTPLGFRAPSSSLDNRTSWLFPQLIDSGYSYDSSVFPSLTPLYGVYGAPISPYWPSKIGVGIPTDFLNSCGILEFPFLALGPKQLRIPLGTGFYLRSLPLLFYRWALNQREKQRIPAVISFHSWEFTSDVPSMRTSPIKGRYLYHGLGYCKPRIESLLKRYSFTSIGQYFQKINQGVPREGFV
jgi:polysaccharide deacetylase family protein (PEP-CTERM system associated)